MNKLIQLELVFWLFTIVVIVAVLIPIYSNIPNYPFWLTNIVFILAAITITRYLFLLKFTFLAKRQILKVGVIFLSIPLLFYLVQELNLFQTYLDEEGIEGIVGHLPYDNRQSVVYNWRV